MSFHFVEGLDVLILGCTWFGFVLAWKVCANWLEGGTEHLWAAVYETLKLTGFLFYFWTEIRKVCPEDSDSVAWGWQRAEGFGLEIPGYSVPIKLPGR